MSIEIDIGIDDFNRKNLAILLSEFLSDTYLVYVKTQNFHWNVVGENFYSLHKLFNNQYEELSNAIDEIAEMIRSLGEKAPGSLERFLELSQIEEAEGNLTDKQMIEELLSDQYKLIKKAKAIFSFADMVRDQPTVDLLNKRMAAHEKAAWMLRSTLQKSDLPD